MPHTPLDVYCPKAAILFKIESSDLDVLDFIHTDINGINAGHGIKGANGRRYIYVDVPCL